MQSPCDRVARDAGLLAGFQVFQDHHVTGQLRLSGDQRVSSLLTIRQLKLRFYTSPRWIHVGGKTCAAKLLKQLKVRITSDKISRRFSQIERVELDELESVARLEQTLAESEAPALPGQGG